MKTNAKIIVVFESIFPGDFDYRGDGEKSESLYFTEKISSSSTTRALYRTSQYQNRYLGYYKIIPLNVVSAKVEASKEGNSFTVELLPDYVFVLYENEQFLPKEIKEKLEQEKADNFSIMNFLDSFLLGTYTSSTSLKGALLRKINLRAVLKEMDTVSIYMQRIPEYIGEDVYDVYFGKNPGRQKELEYRRFQSSKSADILYKAGVSAEDIVSSGRAFKNALYVFRKYSTEFMFSLLKIGTLVLILPKSTQREDVKTREKKNIETLSTSFRQELGGDIYEFYYFPLSRGQIKAKEILAYIDDFYKSDPLSTIITWSFYETMVLRLGQIFGTNFVPPNHYQNGIYQSLRKQDNKARKIIISFVIENLMKLFSPSFIYGSDYTDEALLSAMGDIARGLQAYGINNFAGFKVTPSNLLKLYREGVWIVFDEISKLAGRLMESRSGEKVQEKDFVETGIELKANSSGDGLSLVLRGHISSITESFTISGSNANKFFVISGKGFELPLERHEIYFDRVSVKSLTPPIENFSVSINDPITAARRILENFAPKRVVLQKADAKTINVQIVQNRGFDIFLGVKKGKNNEYVYVLQGNTVAPDYLSSFDNLKIFTPLHYVSTNIFDFVESEHQRLALSQRFFAVNRNLPNNASLMKALKDVVAYQSLYRLFVNNLGELVLVFDISSISVPFSLSLNKPITDAEILKISVSSSEENVATFVEVVPASISITTPSSVSIPAIYGRSTSESLFDMYSSISDISFNQADVNLLKMLDSLLMQLEKNILEAVKLKIKDIRSKKTGEEGNNKSLDALIKELESIDSIFNKTARSKINKFIDGEYETKKEEVSLTSYEVQEQTTNSIESCDGKIVGEVVKTIVPKETRSIVEVQDSVYLFEDNTNLSKIFAVAGYEIFRSIAKSSEPGLLYTSPVALRREVIGENNDVLCKNLNSIAQSFLNQPVDICLKDNLDLLSTFAALGIKKPSVEISSSSGDSLNNFVKNFIRLMKLQTVGLGNLSILNKSVSDPISIDKGISYFKGFFSYIIPSTDIKELEKDLYLTNISPDMFIFGLRTKTFQDSFIGTVDEYKNKDKISTLRAEFFRQLNKKPIHIAEVTILGDSNYYPGTTTLIVSEESMPIQSYISEGTRKQLEYDIKKLKLSENIGSIIAVNEIVEDQKFKKIFPNLLPSGIPGYNPPTEISRDVVAEYLFNSVNFILKKVKYFPSSLYIPLWGVYHNPSSFLQRYIEYIFNYLSLETPEKVSLRRKEIYDALVDLSIEYPEMLSSPKAKYLLTQDYLVAQGHIEHVSHSFDFSNSYETSIKANYLLPAIYTYVPYGKDKKIILGYVVLESPLYQYRENGVENPIINTNSQMKKNFYEFMINSVREMKKYFKEINFIENKVKLNLLDIMFSERI